MDPKNRSSSSNAQLDVFRRGHVLPGRSSDYCIEGFLGEGSFGKVVRCKKLTTGEIVAVKVVQEKYAEESKKEVEQLQKIRTLCPDRNNLLKFTDHFIHLDRFCLVFEMLDQSLSDFMDYRDWKPLEICEIRAIAKQMLVALKALKSIHLVHADIKPDNVMLVHHQMQPFKVKLIDFGLASEASNLWKNGIRQNLSYRAPEVLLGLPSLDEAVDMWTLGCVLVFLFIGEHLYPMVNEYETLKAITHLNGTPDTEFLDRAFRTPRFFNLVQEGPERLWWLKTEVQYAHETGENPKYHANLYPDFFNLDGLIFKQNQRGNPHVYQDTIEFISLLKQTLNVNPRNRITPEEALRHRFITMKHLPLATNHKYVTTAMARMSVCSLDEDSVSPGHTEDKPGASPTSNRTDQGQTITSLQMELERAKRSYKHLRLKYEADAHTWRRQTEGLQLQLKQERRAHAEREAQDKALVDTLGAQLHALHQEMEQERSFLEQSLQATKTHLQTEMEQMRRSYDDMSLKYEADVHTSKQEAERLQQELKHVMKTHAEREVHHQDLEKNLRVQLDTLHQQMEQERSFLEQTLTSTKTDFQMQLEQMKLSYNELNSKYEADVHTSKQEVERLHHDLKDLIKTRAVTEAHHEDLEKNLRVQVDTLHQHLEELSPWRCFKKLMTPAHCRKHKSRRQMQNPQESPN